MDQNPVGWFEIYVADMARARAFYAEVVGAVFAPSPMLDGEMEMVFFESNPEGSGAPGALVNHPIRKPNIEGTLVYFNVADCATSIERATAQGCEIYVPKRSIDEMGFIAIIADSEGNSIGLHSWE